MKKLDYNRYRRVPPPPPPPHPPTQSPGSYTYGIKLVFVSIHLMDYGTALKQQMENPDFHGVLKDSHEESSQETHELLIGGSEWKQTLGSSQLSNLNRENNALSTQPRSKTLSKIYQAVNHFCRQRNKNSGTNQKN